MRLLYIGLWILGAKSSSFSRRVQKPLLSILKKRLIISLTM
jgi:hypothetical protein